VLESEKICLYLWECIAAISKEIEGACITIFIDRSKKKELFLFSPIIHFIDSKFTNFKRDPLELFDLKKV